MDFSSRLKELRTSKGLTQKEAAKLFNITERAYQNYELGRSTPQFSLLIEIADYFQVTLDYLTGRDFVPEASAEER